MPAYIGPGKVRYEDSNGNPLISGKVYVYEAGTVATFADTYDDWQNAIDQVHPQENPVILDGRGEAIIIINEAVKLKVTDANDYPIWTVDNYAVASGEDASTGGYHFSSNSIVNGNSDVVLGLNAVSNANSYVVIDSKASDAPPVIRPVCAAVTNQDLILTPQNNGYITTTNKLKVDYSTAGGNQVVITGVNTGSHPTITTEGADAAPNLVINPKGAGTLDVQANTSITGTLAVSSTLAATGTITGSSTVQGTGIKLSNSGFTASINAPTLAANRTWTWPSADGAANTLLTTNGSGVLSFAASVAVFNSYAVGVSKNSQSINNATETVITLDTEIFDTGNTFNTGTNRLVPSVAGYYRISASAFMAAATFALSLTKNGSIVYTNASTGDVLGNATYSWLIEANGTTDYFQLSIKQSTGSPVNVQNVYFFSNFVGTT